MRLIRLYFIKLAFGVLWWGMSIEPSHAVPTLNIQPSLSLEGGAINPTDVAIWNNPLDETKSLIFGNSFRKKGELIGWDITGKEQIKLSFPSPINFDVMPNVELGGSAPREVLVVVDKDGDKLIVYEIKMDSSAIANITAEDHVPLGMGGHCNHVVLYKRPNDGALFAFVSSNQKGIPIKQFRLLHDGAGAIRGYLARTIPVGDKLVNGLAVDSHHDHIYVSIKEEGITTYYANPNLLNNEPIAQFGQRGTGSWSDLGIYECANGMGFVVLYDNDKNVINIYNRTIPFELVGILNLSKIDGDIGMDVTSQALSDLFPQGILVVHDGHKHNYAVYNWQDVAKSNLSCSIFLDEV